MPPTTTMRVPGIFGATLLRSTRTAIDPTDSATVGQLRLSNACPTAASERKNPCPEKSSVSPSSFGSWPTATVAPTPILRPSTVAPLMFSTSEPSRQSRARSRITPTSSVSIIREPIASSAPAATPAETRVVAVSVAMVEVVETLIARLPPRAA
jgi:hypothetical protein